MGHTILLEVSIILPTPGDFGRESTASEYSFSPMVKFYATTSIPF